MCGRYYIDADDDTIAKLIAQIAAGPDGERLMDMKLGEIYPTNVVPVLADRPRLMQWGFARYDGGGKVINARSETALQKPMFSKATRERRCLLPATNYFEWKRIGSDKKEKNAISLPTGGPLYMAGIYREEKTSPIPVFVILTREAVIGLAHIHDRMPVIFPQAAQREWLSGDCDVPATLTMAVDNLVAHQTEL